MRIEPSDAELDAAVAATDRAPAELTERLPVEQAGLVLMEEIMREPRATRLRRGLVPSIAAAAVVALLAGGAVALGSGDEPKPATVAASSGTPSTAAAPEQAPPTADDLSQVTLPVDGWKVTSASRDPQGGGEIGWSGPNGAEASMAVYPAAEYDAYLQDRKDVGPASPFSMLGQEGQLVTYSDEEGDGAGADGPTPAGPADTADTADTDEQELQDAPAGADDPDAAEPAPARSAVMLPPVGDRFLELDVRAATDQEVRDLLGSFTRVDAAAWEQSLGELVIKPGQGEQFLAQALQGVEMPDGVSLTVADLNLPQDTYQAKVEVAATAACGWAQQYVDGDEQALDRLKASKDWPLLAELAGDGGWPGALADAVRHLERKPRMRDFSMVVGCQ